MAGCGQLGVCRPKGGTIITSTATVLMWFGYVQRIGVGMVHSVCSPVGNVVC